MDEPVSTVKTPEEIKYERALKAFKQCKASNYRLRSNWTKEVNAVKNFESKRQSALEQLQHNLKIVNRTDKQFKTNVHVPITAASKHMSKTVSFPAKLQSSIDAYEKGINAVLANKTDMVGTENKDAIARNIASTALAKKNMEHTKARGEANQTIKQKLIW